MAWKQVQNDLQTHPYKSPGVGHPTTQEGGTPPNPRATTSHVVGLVWREVGG